MLAAMPGKQPLGETHPSRSQLRHTPEVPYAEVVTVEEVGKRRTSRPRNNLSHYVTPPTPFSSTKVPVTTSQSWNGRKRRPQFESQVPRNGQIRPNESVTIEEELSRGWWKEAKILCLIIFSVVVVFVIAFYFLFVPRR